MGIQTVHHVRKTRTYEQALANFESIVPIRGLAPETRPLGQRRQHHTYWVRKNGDNVQYMVYRTPVITYTPGGTIEIRTDGYSSSTTHSFIEWVLSLRCKGYNGKTAVYVDGDVRLIGGNDVLTLAVEKQESSGVVRYSPITKKETLTQLTINRKAANNVRRRYKSFADYLKSFLNLRKESRVIGYGVHSFEEELVSATYQEIADTLGLTEPDNYSRVYFKLGLSVALDTNSHFTRNLEMRTKRQQQRDEFLALIDPNQPEDGRAMNYYKAALLLLAGPREISLRADDDGRVHMVDAYSRSGVQSHANTAVKLFTHALNVFHATEILERVPVDADALPSLRYKDWLIGDEANKVRMKGE